MSAIERLPEFDKGLLRFLTCGSVDDGKSTLIGRLLYDSKAILADTLGGITRSSQRRGMSTVDLSLLTDGLQAEREQGITIDVAYRYFTSGRRKFIIADAPGHEQYTRNMVTAASTADLAIVLIDARRGVMNQTRRHAAIAQLMGIAQVVVAVNKMDLVEHSQQCFEAIKADYVGFSGHSGIGGSGSTPRFIPISALNGDMLVERGNNLDWYRGPTLIETLESAPAARVDADPRLRVPVQLVCRPQTPEQRDFRGYMGRIESGQISLGDVVTVLPAGHTARVIEIQVFARSIPCAGAGQSVTLRLDRDIDISRGDMIVIEEDAPKVAKELEAMVCWLGERPLDPRRNYLLRHTTRETRASVGAISHRLDINTLAREPAAQLLTNDIARVRFKLHQALCVDSYAENRATGAFVVIDESSNHTVGAGMIL
ncbi:sulfate adenylyltransferase subunit 1 [mine drainage metagenome]|uniref:sulfate adenylyltransferase n=1 Tax=mine drainage metagenome TaxID=410659 RepID=A0A1J5RB34_9ZZZZ